MKTLQVFNRSNTNLNSGLILDDSFIEKINLCNRLRRLARLDRIKLDTSKYTYSDNLKLFEYLKFNNIEPLEYVKEYLTCIQPFMIERLQKQEKFDGALCILDTKYRISVYIKVDTTEDREIILSFHENAENGVLKKNSVKVRNSYFVNVLPDTITNKAEFETETVYSIRFFMIRGLMKAPLDIAATRYEYKGHKLYFVRYQDIENVFIRNCNTILEDLFTSNLKLDRDFQIFTVFQQISFTSYGQDIISNVSLLIDAAEIQHDIITMKALDYALVTLAAETEIDSEQMPIMIDMLRKQHTSDIANLLIDRFEDNVQIG